MWNRYVAARYTLYLKTEVHPKNVETLHRQPPKHRRENRLPAGVVPLNRKNQFQPDVAGSAIPL